MDLLGDIGQSDQLTSARAENAVLQQKCKELTMRVNVLTVEKATLEAEVEMYRKEAALPSFSKLALGGGGETAGGSMDLDIDMAALPAFFKSGNGIYCANPEVNLNALHGPANPLCVAMSSDETVVVTGGADGTLRATQWGAAASDGSVPAKNMASLACSSPTICVTNCSAQTVAAGCMDGSVILANYSSLNGGDLQLVRIEANALLTHKKYCKAVAWSADQSMLATASADGDIHLYKVEYDAMAGVGVTHIQSLHLSGVVECIIWYNQFLISHCRGTAVLQKFDTMDDFAPTSIRLNAGQATGGFDEHVSFCVLDLKLHGSYLACATDASRHIIIDLENGNAQVRNLYGHKADGFSVPVIAFSSNGQYLYSNTQDSSELVVYEISSGKIAQQLGTHDRPIRSMYSSSSTDMLITTSFDRKTVIWFVAQ